MKGIPTGYRGTNNGKGNLNIQECGLCGKSLKTRDRWAVFCDACRSGKVRRFIQAHHEICIPDKDLNQIHHAQEFEYHQWRWLKNNLSFYSKAFNDYLNEATERILGDNSFMNP